MLRPKKTSVINRIDHNDEQLLKGLFRVNCFTSTAIKNKLGVETKKLKEWESEGFIYSKNHFNSKTEKLGTIFLLTDKGKNFVERRFGLSFPYYSNSIAHDIRLSNKYLYWAKNEVERESWKCEGFWKNHLKCLRERLAKHDHEASVKLEDYISTYGMSAIDGSFTRINPEDGSEIEISCEVIGDYSEQHKAEKIHFMQYFNISHQYK